MMLLLLSLLVALYFENILDIYKRKTFPDNADLANEDKKNKQGQHVCCDFFFNFDTLYSFFTTLVVRQVCIKICGL
jgi:hypothetical protein